MQDHRTRFERVWDENPVIAACLIVSAIVLAVWVHFRPIPGAAIGLLALMAGVMSVRPKMHFAEKIAWVVLLAVFATLEIRALSQTDKQTIDDKKDLTNKLYTLQESLNTTLRNLYVVKDGIAAMATNRVVTYSTLAPKTVKPSPTQLEAQQPTQTSKRFIDAEKLGLALVHQETSTATVINDGTNEAGNLANQLVIGLLGGKWVAGGNNIKIGDPAYFPDPLTLEVSTVRTSPDDHSVEEAKTLQAALSKQGIVATIRYTQQAFPANFMRVKVAGQ